MLSEEENQYIFDRYIKIDLRPNSTSSKNRNPFAIFLGGQSGSGKSSLLAYVYNQLKQTERDITITINSDKLREYHPDFLGLQRSQPHQASFLVNPDTVKWQQKLIDFALSSRCNLILDGTLGGNPTPILNTIKMLRATGYSVQISLLAVSARVSRFSIYKRYEDQLRLKGSGRWVGLKTHDQQYDDIPKTLSVLESAKAVGQIQIYTRPTGLSPPPLLYDNQVKGGQWQHPSIATNVFIDERNRLWSTDEQAAFIVAVETLAEQMRQRGVSEEEIAHFYRYVECPT